uniref:Uncharacterized protein n=1 Tax=Solanum tuberosum TaxID=4113 RepID=M1BXB0_SOLTU
MQGAHTRRPFFTRMRKPGSTCMHLVPPDQELQGQTLKWHQSSKTKLQSILA